MNKFMGSLGVLLLAASAPLAHAGLEINYSINGGMTVTCGPVGGSNPSVDCPNVTGPPLTVTILGASSNSTGGAPSFDASSVTTFDNNGSSTANILINVISTGFTTPVTPPALVLLSHIGGTVFNGVGSNALNFVSCIDSTDNQTTGCPGTVAAPSLSPSITATGSFEGDSSAAVPSLASGYAIDEQISVTLGAGGEINFSASSTLESTPEPMSIVLLGSLLLGVGLVTRKRSQASQI